MYTNEWMMIRGVINTTSAVCHSKSSGFRFPFNSLLTSADHSGCNLIVGLLLCCCCSSLREAVLNDDLTILLIAVGSRRENRRISFFGLHRCDCCAFQIINAIHYCGNGILVDNTALISQMVNCY
jgi:hypothetical protein